MLRVGLSSELIRDYKKPSPQARKRRCCGCFWGHPLCYLF